MQSNCLVCAGEADAALLSAREMMLGLREKFNYLECGICKSLQLSQIPGDLTRFYPPTYYSFAASGGAGLRARLQARRDAGHFGGGGILGRMLARRIPQRTMTVLAKAGIRPEQRVLDVGCGSGRLLDTLAQAGFRRLLGVDPFVPATTRTAAGVEIRRARLAEVAEEQDVVMFNHSLEHVPEPAEELERAAALLPVEGLCVVRVPTPSSHVREAYGADWVQLDAPRHIALPSREGMARLAERTGFRLERAIDDGWAFGFWGSELYRRDLPINPPEGEAPDPERVFGRERMKGWAAEAAALNAEGRGDQTAFILRRI